MKQKIRFSTFSLVLTGIVLILFVAGIIAIHDNPEKLILFCIIMGGVTLICVIFCPKSIEVADSDIILHRLFAKPITIHLSDIRSVDTCYPSAGGLRLCGNGGYFGYWGYFNDIMIGTYFGCYGSRKNCFLVKLNNGKQYVLGCDNPVEMVDYTNGQLSKL